MSKKFNFQVLLHLGNTGLRAGLSKNSEIVDNAGDGGGGRKRRCPRAERQGGEASKEPRMRGQPGRSPEKGSTDSTADARCHGPTAADWSRGRWRWSGSLFAASAGSSTLPPSSPSPSNGPHAFRNSRSLTSTSIRLSGLVMAARLLWLRHDFSSAIRTITKLIENRFSCPIFNRCLWLKVNWTLLMIIPIFGTMKMKKWFRAGSRKFVPVGNREWSQSVGNVPDIWWEKIVTAFSVFLRGGSKETRFLNAIVNDSPGK